jgi:YfiH family protein
MHKKQNNIFYGISEKKDGDMKIAGENGEKNKENRKLFFKKLNLDYGRVVATKLVHNSTVDFVNNKNAGDLIEGVDGLVTNDASIVLAITVADCVPVYFYDSKNLVIGIAHAGWRGIRKGIIENMLLKLKKQGAKTEILNVIIGPHIKGCHYEVNEDVWHFFKDIPGALVEKHGKTHLKLNKAIISIFTNRGVNINNVSEMNECTHCQKNKYFSYRRDKPKEVQAMVAFIGMVSN